MRRFSLFFTYLVSLLFCFILPMKAQVARTSINGTITDEQGKRIPSAKVKAIDLSTGLERETETSTQGTYSLSSLKAGTFTIEITKPGFAPFRLWKVLQEVGQTRTLDAVLHLPVRTEQVEVTEEMAQLDRVDAAVGAPVEGKLVQELPINGRNWATMTALVPGATDSGAG